MKTDELVQPTLTVDDYGFGTKTSIVASVEVTASLREWAEEQYSLAVKKLTAKGPAPYFDWGSIHEIQGLLAEASEAAAVIRATTPEPDEPTEGREG